VTTLSSIGTVVQVAPGARLTWSPEPGIAALGAHHRNDTRVRLAADSTLVWRDEVTLGRHGEGPGTWRSRIRVTVDSQPALSSDLALGPEAAGWESRSVLAGARAVSTLVIIDGSQPWTEVPPVRRLSFGTADAISLPLARSGAHITAWGAALSDCRAAVEQLVAAENQRSLQ
jgi:urease accessory protein